MPLVSVIIPVLNERAVLPRCLDSVLSQTHGELEVIVVIDEKSTDGSVDLCHDYAERDGRVRVLRDGGNISTARNRGLDAATGEFIQFVDADDAVTPGMTASLLADIGREKTDWASCSAQFIQEDENGEKGGAGRGSDAASHIPSSRGRFTAAEWLKRLAVPADLNHAGMCWNKLYRASVLQGRGVRFPARLACAEDHVFNLDFLAAAESVYVGDKPLYLYIEGAGPAGYLTIRKFHPQCLDFIDFFCRKLVRLAAPACTAPELASLRQEMAGLAILNVIRFCRRDSTFSKAQTLEKLALLTADPDLHEWFAAYRPAPGNSRAVPLFLRLGWPRALFHAARRRADKRYGKYYAPTTTQHDPVKS